MTEIREGSYTCGQCKLGAGVKLDAETASLLTTAAVEMEAGGFEPEARMTDRLLGCAAAIACGACKIYSQKENRLVSRPELPKTDHISPSQVSGYL